MDKPTFLNLGDDIILLIYEELDSMDLTYTNSLPLVSKYLRRLLFPAQNRVLHVYATVEKRRREILRREGGEDLPEVQSIREVRVDRNGSSALDVKDLECILGKLRNLVSFVWNTQIPFPPFIATFLQTHHPALKLRVPNLRTDGPDTKQLWEFDTELLSSPLLHALDIDLHWSWTGSSSTRRLFCQLARLSSALERNGSSSISKRLQNLKIGFDGQRAHGYPDCAHVPPCFTAEEGDQVILHGHEDVAGLLVDGIVPAIDVRFPAGWKLPQLVKIVRPVQDLGRESKAFLRILTERLFMEICEKRGSWMREVRYLELHGLSLHLPFLELLGRVPNLRYIELVLDCSNIVEGLLFLESLENVREMVLVMEGDFGVRFEIGEVWKVIFKQRATLKRLVVHKKMGVLTEEEERFVLKREFVEEFATSFPILENLGVDITGRDAEWLADLGKSSTVIEIEALKAARKGMIAPLLTDLTRLKYLRLFVNLQFYNVPKTSEARDALIFNTGMEMELDLKYARDMVVHLLVQIAFMDVACRLRRLEVVFLAREPDRGGLKREIYEKEVSAVRLKKGAGAVDGTRGGKGRREVIGVRKMEKDGVVRRREWMLFGVDLRSEGQRWAREERVRFERAY